MTASAKVSKESRGCWAVCFLAVIPMAEWHRAVGLKPPWQWGPRKGETSEQAMFLQQCALEAFENVYPLINLSFTNFYVPGESVMLQVVNKANWRAVRWTGTIRGLPMPSGAHLPSQRALGSRISCWRLWILYYRDICPMPLTIASWRYATVSAKKLRGDFGIRTRHKDSWRQTRCSFLCEVDMNLWEFGTECYILNCH